jgi:type I restriction enzyme S subunit
MSEWKEYKIHELGKVVTGTTPSSKNPEDFGHDIMFVTPSDYKSYNNYLQKTVRYLSIVGKNKLKNRVLPKGSVMVTCIGSDMGKVALNPEEAITNQQVNSIIPNNTINNIFLYYKLKDEYDTLRMYGGEGTAVPIVNKSTFENIELLIPSLPEQERIAEVLSSLDDKIDLLHRQNKTLEQMAETLFRQWFVEEAVSIHFGKLGNIIDFFDNKRVPLSSTERDKLKVGKLYPYYGAATIMDYINSYIFDDDYLLLGEDGTVQDENGYPILQRAIGKCWINNHAHVIKGKSGYSNNFLEILLKHTNISHIVTGAVQPKINQANLKELEIPNPSVEKVKKFSLIIDPLFKKKHFNLDQIKQLETLRDILLPKLISGMVKLKI